MSFHVMSNQPMKIVNRKAYYPAHSMNHYVYSINFLEMNMTETNVKAVGNKVNTITFPLTN